MFSSLVNITFFVMLVTFFTGSASANIIQLSNTSELSSSGSNISFVGSDGSSYGTRATFSSSDNDLTITGNSLSGFVVGSDYYYSAFPDNTSILYGYAYNTSTGPLVLDFSQAVSEVGFAIESAHQGFGAYALNFTAYNGSQALGTYNVAGVFPDTLAFLGLEAVGGDEITRLQLNAPSGYEIALGSVEFVNAGTIAKVSEPSAVFLFGLGLLALLGFSYPKRSFI